MNKLLASLFLLCTIAFISCDKKNAGSKAISDAVKNDNTGLKIAYVNIDTLQNNLDFFKVKKEEFDKKEAAARGELATLQRNLQNEYVAFQKAAQAGTLTQADGEAKQKRLGQMQENLQTKQANLEADFAKQLDEFNQELKKRLDDYLAKYNKDKHYDFILSHGNGSQILLANPAYEITADVIKGMNEDAKSGSSTADTTAQK